jgi:hypothetical protein
MKKSSVIGKYNIRYRIHEALEMVLIPGNTVESDPNG